MDNADHEAGGGDKKVRTIEYTFKTWKVKIIQYSFKTWKVKTIQYSFKTWQVKTQDMKNHRVLIQDLKG